MSAYEMTLKKEAEGPARFTVHLAAGALTFNRAQDDPEAVDFRVKGSVLLSDAEAAQYGDDPRFALRKLSEAEAQAKSEGKMKLSRAAKKARAEQMAKMGPAEAAAAAVEASK